MAFLKALSQLFSKKTSSAPSFTDMCDVMTLTPQHYQDFDELYSLLSDYSRGRSDGMYFYSDTPYFYVEDDTFIFRDSQHYSRITKVWHYIRNSSILNHFAAPLIVQRFFQPAVLKKQYGRIPSVQLTALLFGAEPSEFDFHWNHQDPRIIVGRAEIMPDATPFRFITGFILGDVYVVDQFPPKVPKEEPVTESPSRNYDSKKEVDDVVKTTTQKSSTTVSAKPIKIIDDKDLRTNAATGIVHDGPVVATIVSTEQSILPTPHTTIVPCHRAVVEDCAASMPDIFNL